MNKEKNLLPALRFPEFVKDGEWEGSGILSIASMKARIGWQNLRKEEHLDKGDYFLITGTDFKNNMVDWENAKFVSYGRYIQDENIILKEGDILITKDGSIGKVAYVENLNNRKATLNNGIFRIRVVNQYSKFIFYTFLSQRFTLFLQKLSGGSSIVHLYQKDFEKYDLIIPPTKKEQQKIASCLSFLDELITAHNEKLQALKDHKKGLMQNLFPQEGQKAPNYRFSEFKKDEEWKTIALKKVTPPGKKYGIVDGPFGSNLKTIHYKKQGIPIITSGYVTDGIFHAKDYLYVTKEKFEKEKRSAVNGGDIVMAKIGARCGASAIFPLEHEEGILSGNALKITVDENRFSTNFIWQQLWFHHQTQKLDAIKKVGAQPAISISNLKEYCLVIPKRLEEQQKIASCLSALDELITAQSEKIEQLQQHKKGLMQGLFPKMEG